MSDEILLNSKQLQFQKSVRKHLLFQLFLLFKLPAAWLAGLKVDQIDKEKTVVKVKYKWLTQNPFKSIYFAVLAMAAELSTGLLSMMYIQDDKLRISMLVVGVNASFTKKAVGINYFVCEEGIKIYEAIETAKKSMEGVTIQVRSTGYSTTNEIIAIFDFTWSFKVK